MIDRAVPSRAHARQRRALGTVWIAIVFWSATALFVRAGDADPLVFTTWRCWLALPPLAAVLLWRTRRGDQVMLRAPGVSRVRWLFLVLGAGLVWAHRYVPASLSAPLLLAEPPLVAIGAWIVFGESLGPVEIIGSLVVVGALLGMVRSPAVTHVEDDAPDLVPPA